MRAETSPSQQRQGRGHPVDGALAGLQGSESSRFAEDRRLGPTRHRIGGTEIAAVQSSGSTIYFLKKDVSLDVVGMRPSDGRWRWNSEPSKIWKN